MLSKKTISIETITLRGYDVPTMAPKGGPVRCKMCGKPITAWGDNNNHARGVHTVLPNQPSAYVHAGCVWENGREGRQRGYHAPETDFEGEKFAPIRGKAAKDGVAFSFELEAWNRATAEQMVRWGAGYGMIATDDCTVGTEWHMPSRVSLAGFKEFLQGFSAENDLSNPACGAHIHVSFPAEKYNYGDDVGQFYGMQNAMEVLNHYKMILFNGLRKDIACDRTAAAGIWGRTMGGYADNDMGLYHGDWLNLHTNDYQTIEWRLPHFVNAAQYLWCVAMIREFTLELMKFLDKKQDAEHTGKKLRKIYRKYAQGKGNAQRPERNDEKDLQAYREIWEHAEQVLPIKF